MDNIFDSDADAIINTVNIVGVMGGGLAAQFRDRYPAMNADYQQACANRQLEIGKMWSWYDDAGKRWLINFPTKLDWRDPSQNSYVIDGLVDLKKVIADLKLTSIAIPPLGCGLGGLHWEEIEPLIAGALGDLEGVRVDIYPPNGVKYTL